MDCNRPSRASSSPIPLSSGSLLWAGSGLLQNGADKISRLILHLLKRDLTIYLQALQESLSIVPRQLAQSDQSAVLETLHGQGPAEQNDHCFYSVCLMAG